MYKTLKRTFITVFILFAIIVGITLYVGNYVYDYTLNRYSTKSILENIPIDEDDLEKSRKWLNANSLDVYIKSDDNLQLHASYIDQKSKVYVIMIHGYRGEGASIISPIKKMKSQKYNILIPDLRGHGQSEGDYIGMGWDDREDILKWINYILSIDSQASIVLYGVSMGGATVLNVSGEPLPSQVKAIIEDCGYTSVWDVFQTHIPMEKWQSHIALKMASWTTWLRAGYRLEDVQPIKQVQKSKTPILFIHGQDDWFVPSEMLDELYNAASCPKEKLLVNHASHANSCSVASQVYYDTILTFIKKNI